MRAILLQLPNELVDSAKIDGCPSSRSSGGRCSPWRSRPSCSLVVFTFLGIWNEYFLPLIVSTRDARRTLPLGVVHFQSRYYTDYRLVYAALVSASSRSSSSTSRSSASSSAASPWAAR